MKVSITEPSTWKRVLLVEVPSDTVEKKYTDKLDEYRKKVKLPGFRAGKVPVNMLERKMGDSIRADAVEDVLQDSVESIFKEHNLKPINRPLVKKLDYKKGTDLVFEAEIEVDPPVTITHFQGLGIRVPETKVEPKDIEEALHDLQERYAVLKTADRELRNGDYAVLEYLSVIVDGQVRKDFHNPAYPVEVGKSSMPEFDQALLGARAGQEREVKYTFPADHSDEGMRGKNGVFHILVKEVKEKELPAVNDDLAKEAGQFKDLAELKARIQEDLESRKKHQAREEAEQKVLAKIIEQNPFEIPESQITNVVAHEFDRMKKQYPKADLAWEAFYPQRKPAAEFSIKRYKILDAVGKIEQIKATAEEVDAEIRTIAEYRKEDFAKVKDELRHSGATLDLREEIAVRKVLDYLLTN